MALMILSEYTEREKCCLEQQKKNVKNNPRKYTVLFMVLILLMVLLFLTDIFFGSFMLSMSDVWAALTGKETTSTAAEHIVLHFRIPKAIVAMFAGIALSVSGLQMQTLFRNPLADPYVLGISSGAGLGVALFVLGTAFWATSGIVVWLKDFGIVAAGWSGAMAVLSLILVASVRLRNAMTILIFGIMIGGVASAIVGVLQYFSAASALKTYVLWTMGSFSNVSSSQLLLLVVSVLIGLSFAIFSVKNLNVLQVGDVYAQSMGMNVRCARSIIFISAGVLAGTVTAFCGPIGFIGIAAPHVARMTFCNANHGVLIPASILIGASATLASDVISQLPWSGNVLPINTVTALMGIPIILFIIFRNKHR